MKAIEVVSVAQVQLALHTDQILRTLSYVSEVHERYVLTVLTLHCAQHREYDVR